MNVKWIRLPVLAARTDTGRHQLNGEQARAVFRHRYQAGTEQFDFVSSKLGPVNLP